MKYTIERKDPLYGNEKWLLLGTSDLCNSREWFNTEKEAKSRMIIHLNNNGKYKVNN